MANQIFVYPFPCGVSESQHVQELNGTVLLAGSSVTTGEPLNWSDLISGVEYQEINFNGSGLNGNGSALVTVFSGDGTTLTCTAANNFAVGQRIKFKGCTSVCGLLVNGLSFDVATSSASSFTVASTATGTGTSEKGMAIVDKVARPLTQGPTPAQTITVTAVSASGSVGTATAANNLLPGAIVTFGTFTTGTLGPKLVTAGAMVVLNSTSTAFTFTMPSALSGTTGASTAIGVNPPQPFHVTFESALNSGYTYQYNATTGCLFVLQVPAAATLTTVLPQADLTAAVYPAGVLADVVKYTAKFAKSV